MHRAAGNKPGDQAMQSPQWCAALLLFESGLSFVFFVLQTGSHIPFIAISGFPKRKRLLLILMSF
jgi:hypothetical protein